MRRAEAQPSDSYCQPLVFDPSKPSAGERMRPVEVRRVAVAPPFSMTEYSFDCGSTGSSVLEISRGGVRHALYTHVDWDWKLSPDKRTLVMKNAVVGKDGQWENRFRVIDIATKEAVALQRQLRCTAHLMGWTGQRFITSSGAAYQYQDKPEVCVWDTGGLQGRFLASSVEPSSGATDRPINTLELVPREPTGIWGLATAFGDGERFDCELVAVNWKDPSRRYQRRLNVKLDGDSCHRASDRVELDLSAFTFERPTFRYRVVTRQGGGRWQTVQ